MDAKINKLPVPEFLAGSKQLPIGSPEQGVKKPGPDLQMNQDNSTFDRNPPYKNSETVLAENDSPVGSGKSIKVQNGTNGTIFLTS